jgi:leucyl aminopeptidase (aminopeptidase T)
LHYAAPVVEHAVEQISVEGKQLTEVLELDGPSSETIARWQGLTAASIRQWLLQRNPGNWNVTHEPGRRWPERAFTWAVARRFGEHFNLGLDFLVTLLQRARLALMTRYAAWHL